MITLALLLLAVAVVLTAAAVTSNGQHVTFDLWGAIDWKVSLGVVFVAGMITTVLAVLGLLLLTAALRRKRRGRRLRKGSSTTRTSASPEGEAFPPPPDLSSLPGAGPLNLDHPGSNEAQTRKTT